MITGEHTVIRMAEADDAYELRRLYEPEHPRAALLDRRREITTPNVDELREGLAKPDKSGTLYAIEDKTGLVRGFCALRGAAPELGYGEIILPLFDDADYETPLAEEGMAYLMRLAFEQKRLNKIIAHCLDGESALKDILVRHGFKSNGVQREVMWTQGRWHSLETLSRFSDGR